MNSYINSLIWIYKVKVNEQGGDMSVKVKLKVKVKVKVKHS